MTIHRTHNNKLDKILFKPILITSCYFPQSFSFTKYRAFRVMETIGIEVRFAYHAYSRCNAIKNDKDIPSSTLLKFSIRPATIYQCHCDVRRIFHVENCSSTHLSNVLHALSFRSRTLEHMCIIKKNISKFHQQCHDKQLLWLYWSNMKRI